MLAINPLIICSNEAAAEVITFDDGYDQYTPITNQYQDLGVIISGEPGPPIIYNGHDLFGLEDPILGGCSSGCSIIVSFVDPVDGTPIEATNVYFDGYYYFHFFYTLVSITYYDLDENVIGQETLEPATGSLPPFNFPPELHKFVLSLDLLHLLG